MITNNILHSASSAPLAPWLAGLATAIAAFVAAFVALRTHRTTRLVENVTAERAKWRTELRAEMACLSAAVHEALQNKEADYGAFHRARVGILLRINPEGRKLPQPPQGGHRLDLTIDQKLRSLALHICIGKEGLEMHCTREALLSELRLLEYAVQELLKQEWEGSKEEALSGKLKRSAAAGSGR